MNFTSKEMNFTQANAAAVGGAKITRPHRDGHWLTFSNDANCLMLNCDDKSKTPCRWVPMPGDLDAHDWLCIGQPARAEIAGRSLRVAGPPSLPICLFCGSARLMDGECKSCQHQLMLVVAPVVLAQGYKVCVPAINTDMVARDVERVVSALLATR